MKPFLFAFAVLCVFCAGCKTVEPWQRSTLGSRHMQFRPSAQAAQYTAEVHKIIEGSTFDGAALASAGAGCGCQ